MWNLLTMKAEIISIGNELLNGDTVNTNAAWLGEFLTGIGFEVVRIHTISDGHNVIAKTVDTALNESDLVISTGGLGPTHDDMTKKAVADLFGVGYKRDQQVLAHVQAMFEKRNIPFSKSNYAQAEIPENGETLFNKWGTAPGIWFDLEDKHLAVLPGVPYEMKHLIKEKVAPKLREHYGEVGFLYSKYLKTAGVGESILSDEILGDLSLYLNEEVKLAFLPNLGGVTLRLMARGQDKEAAWSKLKPLHDVIYEKAAPFIFGEGKHCSISEAVGDLLREQELRIATAESCTGGLIASSITDIAGSSDYMKGGIVSYADSVKLYQLGVLSDTLESEGAVSKKVALQMAKGVAEKLDADIGISTTGVAGPGGGSEEKPVGTVWIGFYQKEKQYFAVKAFFTKDRLMNKERSKMVALEMVRRVLKGINTMPYDLKKERA
ncbi:MAG: competence/damage-inducible protein A [Balneolaceae bacterium]|nr:competence/damage-inducible protein A [Balneolaceae bacterium]